MNTAKQVVDKLLSEGVWSVPDTLQKASQLSQLMRSPISSKNAPDALYSILGDDALFDQFFKRSADVRPLIVNYLKALIPQVKGKWDPAVIASLENSVRGFKI